MYRDSRIAMVLKMIKGKKPRLLFLHRRDLTLKYRYTEQYLTVVILPYRHLLRGGEKVKNILVANNDRGDTIDTVTIKKPLYFDTGRQRLRRCRYYCH